MIEFTKSYKTSNGQVFGTIEEAQAHEIESLFNMNEVCLTSSATLTQFILKNKDKMVDILTTTPNSKPKARAIHGGTKKRTPKVAVSESSAIMEETINS